MVDLLVHGHGDVGRRTPKTALAGYVCAAHFNEEMINVNDNWPPFQINGSRVRGTSGLRMVGDTMLVTMPAARHGDDNRTVGGLMGKMLSKEVVRVVWSWPIPTRPENMGRMGGPSYFPPNGRLAKIASMGLHFRCGDRLEVDLTLELGAVIPAKYEKEEFMRIADWSNLVVDGEGDGTITEVHILLAPVGRPIGRIHLLRPGSDSPYDRGIDGLDIGIREGKNTVWMSKLRR